MSSAAKYITREEFEPVKHGLERLTIRVEVLTNDVHVLTNQVADLAESIDARFDAVDARFDGVEAQFKALQKMVADGHAALLSAIHQLARPTPTTKS